MLKDGQIAVDSKVGKAWGFTSDIYRNASFLWKLNDDIYVSMILIHQLHQHKGHFTRLIKCIHKARMNVKVPTPVGKMQVVVRKKGFTQSWEHDPITDCNIEVWTLAYPDHPKDPSKT